MKQNRAQDLEKIVKKMGIKKFTFRGNPVSFAEVFSEKGMLSGLAKRADQLCALCLGYGIGCTITDDKETPLGKKVTFDDVTPETLRHLCIIDVIKELGKSSITPGEVKLDDLMYD